MDLHTQNRRCVTILLPPGTEISGGCAQLLVRYTQRRCGAAPWGKISVDQFCGKNGGETLLIARPFAVQTVTVAEYALPLIHKYFID